MNNKKLKKWQVITFICCWLAYALIYFGRVNLSVAIPYIQNDLEISKAQVGLIGSLFFWIYGIGQLTNGYLGDKFSSRIIIFIGLIITAICNIFFGFATSLTIMFIFWSFNGYFQAMLWGPIIKTTSHWFEENKKNSIAIILGTSMVGGNILAWGLSGKILSIANWKWTFWVPGIIILIYSFIWLLTVRDTPNELGLILEEQPTDIKVDTSKPYENNNLSFIEVFKETKLWLIVIGCIAQGIIKDGIGLWGPTLLMETQGLNMKSTTTLILLIPIMNFIGIMFTDWLNKKLNNQEKLTTSILFTFGIISIIAFIKFQSFGPIISLIFLSLASATMYGVNTILLGVIPLRFAKYNKTSLIAGFLNFASYLATGFASFITGLFVDKYGWNFVIISWSILALLGILSITISWKLDKKATLDIQYKKLA
ncbi:MFS transporter, OPA family, glycerol-3-phosphate transporter [Clostridium cavendishii DSM 21758]|uniref:MFS transporter, OPA family, glycerol-3-phosphate transporter n=1 Tax=Clostridium cavendishii DSM 21758 TaxID=1121302 RepID=A0A1M6BMU2_9CLOT|nr:MFS transporter [Clostridium cavendishii]SHI50059.1 MFS transporter, OPA family, glycerol-3-phosphate transporter [Clostridium cavendishii DSM 21758]